MTGYSIGQHPWRQWPTDRRTITHLLSHLVETCGDEVKLTVGEGEYSAREIVQTASRVAATLRAHGAGPGDRVLVISPNRAEIIELFYGCAWNGSILVPVNPALRGDPLRHQLHRTAPTIVIIDRSTAVRVQEAFDVFDADDQPQRLLVDSAPLDYDIDTQQLARDETDGLTVFRPASKGIAPAHVSPETTAAILFTSGTTGPPKGVVMPHGQFWWWSIISCEQLALDPDDVLYTCLPLFHTNALTTPLQAFAAGGRAVIGPKFSVSAFWQRLADADATVTYILGAMSTMLWNRRPARFDRGTSRLRRILGPGIDPAIKVQFEDFFQVQVVEGFGMTEIGAALYTPVSERTQGVLGVPHPDYDIALLAPDDSVVGGAGTGELAVRPRQPWLISEGYFNDTDATLASKRNLWLHTGDLVARDAGGVYRWLDRMKDSIRRRGENISSYEVEAALRRHPAVNDAAVVAVPSGLGEDEVMACVQPTVGVPFDPAAVVMSLSAHLPDYAIPTYVRELDTLPVTSNGKVAKHALRQEGVTADTWERT